MTIRLTPCCLRWLATSERFTSTHEWLVSALRGGALQPIYVCKPYLVENDKTLKCTFRSTVHPVLSNHLWDIQKVLA